MGKSKSVGGRGVGRGIGVPRRVVHGDGYLVSCKALGGDFRVASVSEIEQTSGVSGSIILMTRRFDIDCGMFRDWYNARTSVDLSIEYLVAGKILGKRMLMGCTVETYAEGPRDARLDDYELQESVRVKIAKVGPFVKAKWA